MSATTDARKHAKRVREATAARDKAIIAMRKEGHTFRAIGEVVLLSHVAVQKICDRNGR